MKNLLTIGLIGLAFMGFGQFGEFQFITECHVCPARVIEIVDIDGDNDEDIVYISKELNWLENLGRGRFDNLKRVIPRSEIGEYHIYVEDHPLFIDIDNDGYKDFVTFLRVSASSPVVWYKNDGRGSFSKPRDLCDCSTSFHFFDLDQDGDLDIVSPNDYQVNSSIYHLEWYENSGYGNFKRSQSIGIGGHNGKRPDAFFVEDIDVDGDLDILTPWQVHISDNSTYTRKDLSFDGEPFGKNFGELHFLNLDGDSRTDAVQFKTDAIIWFENDNTENFFTQKILVNNPGNIYNPKITDFDEDGDNDILYAVDSTSHFIVWLNNEGGGNFSVKEFETSEIYGNWNYAIGELTGDNKKDIVGIPSLQGQVYLLKNQTDFDFQEQILVQDSIDNIADITVSDLDGDDNDDIIVTSRYNDKVVWFKNEARTDFSSLKTITESFREPYAVQAVDIDMNGTTDVIASFIKDDLLAWFSNNGRGEFDSENIIDEGVGAVTSLEVFDLDNDGDKDVVIGTKDRGEVVWYENFGAGLFSGKIVLSDQYESINDIVVTDLDRDGNLDIVVVPNLPELEWLRGDGLGNFISDLLFDSQFTAKSIFVEDLDGDEDLDIFRTPLRFNRDIGWLKNNGMEEFNSIAVNHALNSKEGVLLLDFDSDNDIDVLQPQNYYINLYENDGKGNFSSSIPWYQGNIFFCAENDINLININEKGLDDLLLCGSEYSQISWIERKIASPTIRGLVYHDVNENGVCDSTETFVNSVPVELYGEGISFTNTDGFFSFYVPEGKYTLTAKPGKCWAVSSDSSEFTVNTTDTTSYFKFGVKEVSDYQYTNLYVKSGATRCGFTVPFWLTLKNNGCSSTTGKFGLVLDSLVSLDSLEIPADEIVGDTLFWYYDSLDVGEVRKLYASFQIAGTDFLGDTIKMKSLTYIENENGQLVESGNYDYRSEIRCAYDPNDKLVSPNRSANYDQNYTLFGEELEYTVRFQNTGNDTAFTVVIKDYLDEKLDWSTFRPIAASHPFETQLYKDGLIEFRFNNILLPDSTTNEPKSHGFVHYKIKPNEGLEENTILKNTASIFFDFNPPIVTNTTSNVIVSELPKGNKNANWQAKEQIKVFPNPFNYNITFTWDNSTAQYNIQLYDAHGRAAQQAQAVSSGYEVYVEKLPVGLYFYKVFNQTGSLVSSGKVVKHSND